MRIVIHPVADPGSELDLTNRLVEAIAQELWRVYGDDEDVNRLEAERQLEEIVREPRREAAEPEPQAAARLGAEARGFAREMHDRCPGCRRCAVRCAAAARRDRATQPARGLAVSDALAGRAIGPVALPAAP